MNESAGSANTSVQGADVLLRAGIAAARSGRREHARDLLIRALKQDPRNTLAWLWLSGVVDRPEQQRECLKQVLALDPGNQAARNGLALLQRQEAAHLVKAGIAAARSGRREHARDLLIRALKQDPRNTLAWLWLSGVVDRPEQQRECLKQVLALDPQNQAARRGLASLEKAEEAKPVFAAPAVAIEPRRLQVGHAVPRRRISIRRVALGTLLGAVSLAIALFVLRPSLASYFVGLMSPPSAFSSPGTAGVATAPLTPLSTEAPPDTHSNPAQVASSTAISSTGHGLAASTDTPTPLPTATPQPTVTPTPIVYPPTRIVIPPIGVDAPVVLARSRITDTGGVVHLIWDVPEASSAGWHEGSAPLGVVGNTVINGHNWPQGAVFRDLYRVQPGETITLYSGDVSFLYTITEVLLLHEAGQPWDVRQANAAYIQATDDERVTLFTCYPYGSIQNRLIVIARPMRP